MSTLLRDDSSWLRARQQSGNSPSPPASDDNRVKVAVLIVVVTAIVASVGLLTYLSLKNLRLRHSEPKYIPTAYLKQRWRSWRPRGTYGTGGVYSAGLQEDQHDGMTLRFHSGQRSAIASSQHLPPDLEHAEVGRNSTVSDVDRRVSVRSVMTLPAYSRSVRESERILGREGDRDGIDVVVEAPETLEEEEERREEEMSSLFDIRQQRRAEIRERNERRDRRREARARGDVDELRRIQEESRLAARQRETAGAAVMMLEHQSRSRERRVSSVSYADLGIARHDGTRVRANSNDSDRPLLNSAASMSGASARPTSLQDTLSIHHRGQSTSSLSDVGSDHEFPSYDRAGLDFDPVSQTHSRNNSRAMVGPRSRASSTALTLNTADIDLDASVDPPSYDAAPSEEAPPYVSPIQQHDTESIEDPRRQSQLKPLPQLPDIIRLPSIRIAEATPIEPRATVDLPSPVRDDRPSSSATRS